MLRSANFLQYFIWGSWLISLGGYLIVILKFTGSQVGAIYGTMGAASLFMPALLGIVADRWLNAERVLGLAHIAGGVLLLCVSKATDFKTVYLLMLLNSIFYMPTIALNNTVCFSVLSREHADLVKAFPPIRVWGTVGFVVAMWVVDFGGWSLSATQLHVAAYASFALGLYSFTLPACPPAHEKETGSAFGFDAFKLFKRREMLVFFIFAMLLGAALQITNSFGEAFLHSFSSAYPNSFAVKHPGLLMSVSQCSETLFILTIPFFLKKFGIKKVMLMSMLAWMLRFAFFAIGNPGSGLVWLSLSMLVYGMAFDFFNVSGSLFVREQAERKITASAQGLFMLMTNGVGAFLGGNLSGLVVDYATRNGHTDWPKVWWIFSGYALALALAFPLLFKGKKGRA